MPDLHTVARKLHGNGPCDPRLRDHGWLRRRYEDEDASMDDLAEQIGCGTTSVRRALTRAGLEVRSISGAVEQQLRDEEWLRERYVDDHASLSAIAGELDCSRGPVRRALARADVEIRSRSPRSVYCDEYETEFDSRWEHDVAHAIEDHLGVSWLAQEWYVTDAGRYKADFRLPRQNTAIEVKGRVDYGDGYTQAPQLRKLMDDGVRVLVVGGDEAHEKIPHDAFAEYTNDRDALAGALENALRSSFG